MRIRKHSERDTFFESPPIEHVGDLIREDMFFLTEMRRPVIDLHNSLSRRVRTTNAHTIKGVWLPLPAFIPIALKVEIKTQRGLLYEEHLYAFEPSVFEHPAGWDFELMGDSYGDPLTSGVLNPRSHIDFHQLPLDPLHEATEADYFYTD